MVIIDLMPWSYSSFFLDESASLKCAVGLELISKTGFSFERDVFSIHDTIRNVLAPKNLLITLNTVHGSTSDAQIPRKCCDSGVGWNNLYKDELCVSSLLNEMSRAVDIHAHGFLILVMFYST